MAQAGVLASIAAAARLYGWRRLPDAAGAVNTAVSAGFVLLALALWIGLDYWAQDTAVQFDPGGVPGIAWYLLGAIGLAWLAAARTHPPQGLASTTWVLAVLAPLAVAGTFLASYFETPLAWIIPGLTALLIAAYAAHALRCFSGHGQTAAALTLLVAAIGFWVLSDGFAVNASVWYADEQETAGTPWVDTERSLYEQPERIATALAQVAPHSGNAPQAYFLGFAGVGEERVFAQEIELAASAIGRRYGTAERSLLLINDQRDLDSRPLATVAGLELALKGLAAKMDPRQDILFLVLSSHGSDDPLLAVSNAGMPLNQLDAQAVASALDDAGIRHRVIIISACHAGAFIPPLRNDDTIILTAAAADRTSFGCGSDRELTYFGEALFRDALPRAADLKDAFDQAAHALAERETAEHETPSHPQAFYGAQMATRLADFERRHHPPLETGSSQ